MSADDLATLRARVAELERDCAEAYQVVGALWPPGDPAVVKALDNLDAAATGKPRPHDDLLPFVPTPDPRDASLPWPCTCGRTSMVGCDRCDPRDARIAELKAALRDIERRGEAFRSAKRAIIADCVMDLDWCRERARRALGEEPSGG